MKKVEENRSLMDIIRTRQKNWIGHILRGNSLQRKIMEGRKDGREERKSRGVQYVHWVMHKCIEA